ncbi:hypothetical protein BJH93_13590 [Kocuria polaris]|nr:hypothetical protein [Kocuria polaris]
MPTPLTRRTLLASGAVIGAASWLSAPAALADPRKNTAATVTPIAEVLDGGEQVVSLRLESSALSRATRSSLTTSTFAVRVTATNPLDGTVAYAQDRIVVAANWTGRREITLDLEHGWGVDGGGTLQYMPAPGRNVLLDLHYEISQAQPLEGAGRGEPVVLDSPHQGPLTDPEVDAFSHHTSTSGLNYRLFAPTGGPGRNGAALVVWLHGGGEGGMLTDGQEYYDNEAPLRANRGALGFTTPEAQALFGGAYVLAPQSTSAWMRDGDGFAPLIMDAIREVAGAHRIDARRIHVIGCSNGGFMALKMVAEYPEFFATSTPICCGIGARDGSDDFFISDDELAAMKTPTWLVTSTDDDVLDAEANTVHAHELIDGSIMSLYADVTWNGTTYPGHWSWIYAARNDPQHEGASLWEWMARTRR